jgi:amino acid transporter
MRMLPLAAATYFMVSGGPYAIEDILGGAGYLKALILLMVLPLVWCLPTTLMIGELASSIPAEGGFYIWVRRAMGPFWGFQEAWLSLTASIFDMAIYPAIFVLYLGKLAPAWTAGPRAGLWAFAVVAVCCVWNLWGAPAVGNGSVSLFVALSSPFLLIVLLALWWGIHAPFVGVSWGTPPGGTGIETAILVALWNYMGWDNASTVAQEVSDPQRTYPRAMALSTVAVALSYVLPVAALAMAGFSPAGFTTGSWTDTARALGGPWLGVAVVVGGTLSGLGMFNSLTLSYTRLPLSLAEDGLLPSWLAVKNRRGVPVWAVAACGVGWALALRFPFERLISIDLILYGASLILEFVALIVLRFREPDLPRPFRAGNLAMAIAIGAGPTAMILFAIYAARDERLAGMPALLFALLVAGIGPCTYWLSGKLWGGRSRPEIQGMEASPD